MAYVGINVHKNQRSYGGLLGIRVISDHSDSRPAKHTFSVSSF
jgi:hypothetical protein